MRENKDPFPTLVLLKGIFDFNSIHAFNSNKARNECKNTALPYNSGIQLWREIVYYGKRTRDAKFPSEWTNNSKDYQACKSKFSYVCLQ